MKKLAWVFLAMALAMPVVALAQTSWNIDDPIVPKGCDGPNCTCDHLVQLANNVMNFGIFIAVTMSAFLFLWAGFRYMNNASNPVEKQEVKNLLLNILIGLVLTLGAWLIVNTLVRSISDNKVVRNVFDNICNGTPTPGSQRAVDQGCDPVTQMGCS